MLTTELAPLAGNSMTCKQNRDTKTQRAAPVRARPAMQVFNPVTETEQHASLRPARGQVKQKGPIQRASMITTATAVAMPSTTLMAARLLCGRVRGSGRGRPWRGMTGHLKTGEVRMAAKVEVNGRFGMQANLGMFYFGLVDSSADGGCLALRIFAPCNCMLLSQHSGTDSNVKYLSASAWDAVTSRPQARHRKWPKAESSGWLGMLRS